MENKKIIKLFKLTAELLELHDENPFKVRSYGNAVGALELVEAPLAGMSQAQLEEIGGVGKGIAAKIVEINATGSFEELDQMLAATPPGVMEMLRIKGIGPKKVRTIWKELGTETVEDLLEACEQDKLSKVKGFGAKTQDNIRQALLFTQQNRGKLLYAEAEPAAEDLLQQLTGILPETEIALAGDVRRRMEIVESLQFVVGTDTPVAVAEALTKLEVLTQDEQASGPWVWRGQHTVSGLQTEVYLAPTARFANELLTRSASDAHLTTIFAANKSLLSVIRQENHATEEDVYAAAGMGYVEPEMREGTTELQLAMENKLPKLLELSDLKGSLHNHSTYSDGAHTLEQMATFLKEEGYGYLGISDHSKTASYAGGLREGDVLRQQKAPWQVIPSRLLYLRLSLPEILFHFLRRFGIKGHLFGQASFAPNQHAVLHIGVAAGMVGVGVNAEHHALLQRILHPTPVQVQAPGVCVYLDDDVVGSTGIDHHFVVDRVTLTAQQQAACRVAEYGGIRVLDGGDEAVRCLFLVHVQDAVHRGHHKVKRLQNVVFIIQ